MPELDENKIKANNITAEDKSEALSDETINALQDFGKVLQRIHNRLFIEGVCIEIDSHYAQRNRNK